MSYTINTATTVHAGVEGGFAATRCGAEIAKGGTLHRTDKAVTCKRCISFHGVAHNGSTTPAKAAPVAKAVKTWTCKHCGGTETVLPYGEQIRQHNLANRKCLLGF